MNAPRIGDLSIRAKLLGGALLTGLIAVALSGLTIVAYDSATYKRQMLDELTGQAEVLGAISSAALTFDDPKAAQEYLSTLKARPSILEAVLYDAQGRVFATYHRKAGPPLDPPSLESEGYRFEGDHLVLFRRVMAGGDDVGTVFLRADLRLKARRLRYMGIVLLVMTGALGVAALLSLRMQSLISQPLLEVTQAARAVVERQDYSQIVVKRGRDEVGVLVDAFNQMLERIQQREAALRNANAALQAETLEHKAARDEVAALNQSLERRVADRTLELETVNRELESFSYSVSHDLRAPLRAIDGFTMLLQKGYADRFDGPANGYMERVRAATQRMGNLIDDLLNLSRSARSEMARTDLNLSELARAIAHELRVSTPGRRAAFAIEPELRAHADPTLMRVVLENLMGNAWKFTRNREEARIEVGRTLAAGKPAFFVRDNGAGFDMRYVDKLFGAFQRLHAMNDYEGTGVGLANVQRIIARHGGRIWAEGAVDQGAVFYFTLPD
ncbi:MAG TPA: ATP-binding protein [Holophagaceae bacterium]|nr:ATP-binding protein [Holophagaceae bacterium]